MCSCNKNIHRYVCRLVGREKFLIVGVDSQLLLLAVVIFPTIGGGSLHLHCIVML